MLFYIFAALSLLTLGLLLWQVVLGLRFPLNRRNPSPSAPPLTILKPLKGCDSETVHCLRSWLAQDYPAPVQFLFGVATSDDPACAVVQKLLAEFPAGDARLVVCPDQLGPNAKVSTLVQLEKLARHEVIVISDADVLVPRDLLRELVGPLRDPGTGLVNCFYRFANPANLAMRLEAFAINSDFWSQVLQAGSLAPMNFALGAVMATTRARLSAAGGFSALLDYLADDYQLGNRIAAAGGRIVICPAVVECWNAPMTARQVWSHQLRWARTIRVSRPISYFLSILGNTTLWPLLWVSASPTRPAIYDAATVLAIRMLSGLFLIRKFTGRWDLDALWLAPLKDLLSLAIWVSAFAGKSVSWRGEQFRVLRGGKLVRIEGQPDS